MAECLPQLHACAMRVAVLGSNGAPVAGAGNQYTTDALVSVTFEPEVADGEEIEEKNACGVVCVSHKSDPTLKWYNTVITLCSNDPTLEAMLSQGTVLDLGGANPNGYALPPLGPLSAGNGVSVEVWAKRINGSDLDADFPYAWWAFPKVTNLAPTGSRVLGAEAQKPAFAGRMVENPNWDDGPDNDWPAASDRAGQWVPTTDLPDIDCGPSVLLAS